jgi:Mo-co oxidoreductase dimerisation domain
MHQQCDWPRAAAPLVLACQSSVPAQNSDANETKWLILCSACAAAVELMQTQEICCRGYDSSQNSQPNTFTWNLMGMMNNCVYRVKVGGCACPWEYTVHCHAQVRPTHAAHQRQAHVARAPVRQHQSSGQHSAFC